MLKTGERVVSAVLCVGSVWISALMANDSVDEKVCVAALSLSEADRFESAGLKQS